MLIKKFNMLNALIYILVIFSTLFLDANFDILKYLIENFPGIAVNGIRYLLVSGFVLITLVWGEASLFMLKKKNVWALLCLGFIGLNSLINLLFPGIFCSSTINKALLVSANPLITTFLASLILKNPVRYSRRIAMVFSLTAVSAFLAQGPLKEITTSKTVICDAIVSGFNLCWVIYYIGCRYRHKNSIQYIKCHTTRNRPYFLTNSTLSYMRSE